MSTLTLTFDFHFLLHTLKPVTGQPTNVQLLQCCAVRADSLSHRRAKKSHNHRWTLHAKLDVCQLVLIIMFVKLFKHGNFNFVFLFSTKQCITRLVTRQLRQLFVQICFAHFPFSSLYLRFVVIICLTYTSFQLNWFGSFCVILLQRAHRQTKPFILQY